MKRTIFVYFISLAVLIPSASYAYGPSTHVGQAMRYLELLQSDPLPGPRGDLATLSDPNNLPYLTLGATFPDIGRLLPGRYFEPHDEGFAYYVFEKAVAEYGTDPWKLAFGVGYMMHDGGDISSQIFLTPRLAIKGGWGELSVVDGVMDDHPGGENEVLVEGFVELKYGDLSVYLELADFFLAQGHLADVLTFYNEAGVEYFGPPPGALNAAAQSRAVAEYLRDWAGFMKKWKISGLPNFLVSAISREYPGSPAASGFGINGRELTRLFSGPTFADPTFWDDYPNAFKDLGPIIVRSFSPGENWYDQWPTWSETVMKSGSLESLTTFKPGIYQPDADVVLFDLHWRDQDGNELASVDESNPPQEVRCVVTLFVTAPVTRTVTARIRRHLVGVDPSADPIIATQSVTFTNDPNEYSATERPEVTVAINPAGNTDDTWGFVCDLVSDAQPDRPFFTTNYEAFYSISEIDILGIGAYQTLYGMYDKWPRTLRVVNQNFPGGVFLLRGKVRDKATFNPIPAATVTLGLQSATTNDNGYYELVGLPAGANELSATADLHAMPDEPLMVTGNAGDNIFYDPLLLPVARVSDEGDFTSSSTEISATWEAIDLAWTTYRFDVCAGTQPGGEDLALWKSVGQEKQAKLTFAEAIPDGTTVYVSVRICNAQRCFPVRSSDGIVVDASPPEAPVLSAAPEVLPRDGGEITVTVTAADPHSGIGVVELAAGRSPDSAEYQPWTAVTSPVTLSIPPVPWIDKSVFIRARATNKAGLVSEEGVLEVIVMPWTDNDTDDAGADDSTDDDSLANAKENSSSPGNDHGCGC